MGIKEQIIEFANTYIQSDFKFREYQLEEIEKVVSRVIASPGKVWETVYKEDGSIDDTWYEHITTVNAPTGSGKSLILMISAGVLWKYYKKNSYILVSDTYLWKQYDDFLESHPKLSNMFASIKGQQNPEYVCDMNGENVTKGACKLKGISWIKMSNENTSSKLGFNCTDTCPYLVKRKASQLAPITIMTYHLWCTATCATLQPDFDTKWKWGYRDATFCDECHNVPSIFGNIIAMHMSWSKVEKLIDLVNFSKTMKDEMVCLDFLDSIESSGTDSLSKEEMIKCIAALVDKYPNDEAIINQFKPYFKLWDSKAANDYPKEIIESLKGLQKDLGEFIFFAEKMMKYFNSKNNYDDKISMSTAEYALFDLCTWLGNFNHSMEVWLQLSSGNAVVTKETRLDRNNQEKITYTFRDADEANIVANRLLSFNNVILTSATTGPQSISERELGIDITRKYYQEKDYPYNLNIQFDNIPNTFDYSKSPINVIGRWNMGVKTRDKNLPLVSDAIYKIIQSIADEKGIIHTHTYSNAKYIYDHAPDSIKYRLLLYNDSKNKHDILDQHANSKTPTVLIGPTLSEGVDMPGDLCKFLIIMKMPYPYLGDDLVRAKIKLFPYWYNFTTSKVLIQSIGRGNRFKDDQCVTYILDSAFIKFYNENQWMFPIEIQRRMKFFK